jgi:hypothetical protein
MYDIDVCKAAGQYRKQNECNNDKTNINREYSGNNRRGDMGDQRAVRECQGYVFFDSVGRSEAHELANDREAECDIRAAQVSAKRTRASVHGPARQLVHQNAGLHGTSGNGAAGYYTKGAVETQNTCTAAPMAGSHIGRNLPGKEIRVRQWQSMELLLVGTHCPLIPHITSPIVPAIFPILILVLSLLHSFCFL